MKKSLLDEGEENSHVYNLAKPETSLRFNRGPSGVRTEWCNCINYLVPGVVVI